MKTEWRTSTVVQLCQAIRETQDYHVSPILADALQDAGCDNEELLAVLRTGSQLNKQRAVATAFSEETEASVKWMDEFAAEFGPESYDYQYDEDYNERNRTPIGEMTYEKLMDGARTYLTDGWSGGITQHNGQSWQDVLAEKIDDFWDNFEKVTGTVVKDHHNTFIGCSC